MLENYDLKQGTFTLSLSINASHSVVFDSWATQGDMESWGFKKSQFYNHDKTPLTIGERICENHSFEWGWHSAPSATTDGTVRSITDKRDVIFDIDHEGFLLLECVNEGNGSTKLKLSHCDIPIEKRTGDHLEHWILCWSFWLINLKTFLEHGVSLSEEKIPLNHKTFDQVVNY